MILSSIITSIIGPFANLFGWVLAGFYSFTHSYGLSIILLTLTAMVLAFPLTRAGTRSMMRMQLLQPELVKIRNKHKTTPGMSTEDRQAARVALNEEMMALYKENGVNPTGGCLPLFLQFPIFIVLYNVIRGMTHEVTIPPSTTPVLQPLYIPMHTQLYHAVLTSGGNLDWLGINLADSVRTQGSLVDKIPYIVIILIAVALQYVSIWQITNRNPNAAGANPQMQAIQKFMPLIFLVIYIAFPAGVGLYFIVSSAFRIGQQEYMYKHDPKIVASVKQIRDMKAIDAKAKPSKPIRNSTAAAALTEGSEPAKETPPPSRGFSQRLRDAAAGFSGAATDTSSSSLSEVATTNEDAPANGSEPKSSTTKANSNGSTPPSSVAGSQNRSRDKRRRR